MSIKPISPWMVELAGHKFDLQELSNLNLEPTISITEEANRFYLRADEFNVCTEARDVLNRGTEILKVINGIGQLEIQNWQTINVCGVARDESNGTRSQFLFAEPAIVRAKVSANLTVNKVDGTVITSRPRSSIEPFLRIAKKESNVNKALRIYGTREHNWVNLYIIYEIIESDVGGKSVIINNGWGSQPKIEKFKHTANSVGAVGDDARHGKENTHPPTSPMSLSDAKDMIRGMLKQCVQAK